MQGDFTRNTFDKNKHYSRVLQQQGRVQLDADWNEAFEIATYRDRVTRYDVIGGCCAPENDAGYAITIDGANLRIGIGRYYVAGILCENDVSHLFTGQPDFPGAILPGASGRYLAYLDVWERHITALEDGDIREPALGGPDTATRVQVVTQVRLQQVNDGATCADFAAGFRPNLPLASTGNLTARAQPETGSTEPCIVPASAGYRRLENQLYRVQILDAGGLGTATFLYSRENGSVVAEWVDQDGDNIIIANQGRDDNLSFRIDDWVELTDDGRELRGEPGVVVKLIDVNDKTLTIDPNGAVIDINNFAETRKVRRWDSDGPQTVEIAADNQGYLRLEDGVEILFGPAAGAHFQTGDYWLIPARTNLGDVLWPRDAVGPLAQPRMGIEHYYCPLALVDRTAAGWQLVDDGDCRCLFPPLSDLKAEDISYENANCQPELAGATTVQEALDILCRTNGGGRCTFHVAPGADLQAVFDAIPDGGDALICFAVGEYESAETAQAVAKGHLVLSGSGWGTKLVTAEQEAAIRFEKCASVTIEHLSAESRIGKLVIGNTLNGVLTFSDCGDVTVDDVQVIGVPGTSRAASCIRVNNAVDPVVQSTVRIRHCDLHVGNLQTGILLTNVWRSHVSDNVMRVVQSPRTATINTLVTDKVARGKLRNLLVANARITNAAPARLGASRTRGNVVGITIGRESIFFTTHPALANADLWQTLVSDTIRRGDTAQQALYRAADSILLNTSGATSIPAVRRWLAAARTDQGSVAGQGIVIGGSNATDVRIFDNTIQDVIQGIHVGLSHRENQRGTPDRAVTILVRGNTVNCTLPSTATGERHGIFVGNGDSVLIDDNKITLQRTGSTSELHIEGIRVFGYMGKRMIVRHNHIADFNTGVRFNPLNPLGDPRRPQWLIADNVASVSITNDNTNIPIADQRARVRQSENYA